MNKLIFLRRLILAICVMLLAAGTPGAAVLAQANSPSTEAVVCKLDGITYAGEGIDETMTWGPAALLVAPDGSFWIADTAAARIVQYTSDCRKGTVIDLAEDIVGVTDLAGDGQMLWVLDSSAMVPAVIQFSIMGEELARYPLPVEIQAGLSGIALDAAGQPIIEQYGGANLASLLNDQPGVLGMEPSGYETTAGTASINLAPNGSTPNTALVTTPSARIEITTTQWLGGVQYLGSAPDGRLYVPVEEVALVDGAIAVDQTVRAYASDGTWLGTARVDLKGQYTYVAHSTSLGPDGQMYHLATRPEGVEIIRLDFSQNLPALLPEPALTDTIETEPVVMEAGIQAISPATMVTTARAYLNNSKYLSATNISGACSGRTKPRYLGSAGTYGSVSYDWNGFDTISEFNGAMSPGAYQAGDIDTNSQSCSRGVDCSGYVSRVWGLTTKYGTTTLPNISWQLSSVGALQRGDILNLYNSHVVLFDSFAPNGVNAYESTTYNSYDRVVKIYSSWSRLSSYLPRRYNNAGADSCSGQYRAEYYNNRYLAGTPSTTRCEGYPINYDWGSSSPISGVATDNFSVRWAGNAYFSGGSYTFIATADDGVRVWLDQYLIIDAWRDQGATEYRTTRTVTAGYHNVQVDYYENGGGAVARFSWESNQASPNLALYRPTTASSIEGSGYESSRGNDGNTGSRWSSRHASSGDEWWRVDLASTRSLNLVTMRWEAAYAGLYFVGWSYDGTNFTGYWYNIGSAGTYQHQLGAQSGRYVAVIARTRAPGMANFSFYEMEVYNRTLQGEDLVNGDALLVEPIEGPVQMTILPEEQIYLPVITR